MAFRGKKRFYTLEETQDIVLGDMEFEDIVLQDYSSDESDLLATTSRSNYEYPPDESAPSNTQSVSAPPSKEATVRPRKALSKSKTGRKRASPSATLPAPSDRWKNRDEEDTAPNPRRFVPARDTGPVLDKNASWTVLQLFQLFFSSATVNTIIVNTNTNAERQKQAGKKYKWTPLTLYCCSQDLSVHTQDRIIMVQFADAEETAEETPNTCMPVYFGEDATAMRKYCKKCFDAGDKRVKTPVYCRKCQVPHLQK